MKYLLSIVLLLFFGADKLFADTYVKLLSDTAESDIYINGDVSGTYYDEPIQFILPPGEYVLEVKKEYGDGRYGYFKRVIKAGKIDTKVAIKAELKTVFTHDYYFKNATTLAGAELYLEKFPSGQFSSQMRSFIERELANNATTVADAKVYLTRYPNGRYRSAVLKRDIYLVTFKKEDRDGVIKTYQYDYNRRGQLLVESYKSSDGYWKKQTYSYNGAGLLAEKKTERKGQVTLRDVYSYDNNGWLAQERHYQEDKYTRHVAYKYDERGNQTEKLDQTVLDGKFRAFLSYKTNYEYDDNNNLINEYQEHLEDGSWEQVDYSYDEGGFLVKKRRQKGGRRSFDKTYEYARPTIESVRDDQGRVLTEVIDPASKYPINVDYQYGASGTLAEKNKRFSDGRRIRYIYDEFGNLTEEHYFPDSEGDTYTTSWAFKAFKLKDVIGSEYTR